MYGKEEDIEMRSKSYYVYIYRWLLSTLARVFLYADFMRIVKNVIKYSYLEDRYTYLSSVSQIAELTKHKTVAMATNSG